MRLLLTLILIAFIPTESMAKVGGRGRVGRSVRSVPKVRPSAPRVKSTPSTPTPSSHTQPIVVEQKSSSFMPFMTGALVGNVLSSKGNAEASTPKEEKKEDDKN